MEKHTSKTIGNYDARLISQAPALIEALKTIVDKWDSIPITHKHAGMVDSIRKAREVIQKAEVQE